LRQRRLHRALIAAAVLVATPARADPLPRVGVAVSVEVNIGPDEAKKVSEALGAALHEKLMVDVIAGTEAARRLPEDGVPDSCVIDKACIADVAQRLSADKILFLVVVQVGSRVQVDTTWADPATGRTVSRPAVIIERGEDPAVKFASSAALLMPDARPRPAELAPPDGGGVFAGDLQPAMIVRERPRRMTTGAWIAAGVGGAALAGAVTFTFLARKDYQDCEPAGSCSNGELASLESKALAADLLWGTSAAAAVTTGFLYWVSGGQVEQVPATALQVGPGPGVGLSLGGAL
jgi:hypothetical protein